MRSTLQKMTEPLIRFARRNSSQLLLGFGVTGFLAAIVMGVKATPETLRDLDRAEAEKGEPLSSMETFKIGAKHYAATTAVAACSTACVIGSYCAETRKTAAMATLCTAAEESLTSYRGTIRKELGEKKEEALTEAANASLVAEKVAGDIALGYGESIFYDPWSGHFFGSSWDKILAAQNAVNLRLATGDDVTQNEFYDLIDSRDLPNTQYGNYMGFRGDDFVKQLDVHRAYGPTKDGRSCTVLSYKVFPLSELDRYYPSECVL